MTLRVKETPGGVATRTRVVNGEHVQYIDAAPAQKTYITPRELIDLTNGAVHTLSIPTGARFATARLIGTQDSDCANFSFGEDPLASIGAGEPIYHKEEIEIASPSQFRIRKLTAAGNIYLIVHYWDLA